MEYLLKKSWVYILFWLAAISFFGGLVYYFYALNHAGIIISLLLSLAASVLFIYYDFTSDKNNSHVQLLPPREKTPTSGYPLSAFSLLYLFFFAASFITLFKFRTAEAIISPWQVLPWFYWFFYSAASLFLLLALYFKNKFSLALIILHAVLSFFVAVIIYRLGYGYDPFIHNATVELIKKTGSVDPKPVYYLGQYALVVIINTLTNIPVFWIDKLLVPALTTIFLPLAIFRFCRQWFDNENYSFFALVLLLALPYTIFISTTPQNISYLFLLLVIFIGLASNKTFDLILVLLLALAALITQPIAGIPAVIFTLVLFLFKQNKIQAKKILLIIMLLIMSLSLPAAFYFTEKNISPNADSIDLVSDLPLFNLSSLLINAPNQEKVFLNLIYTYIFNIKFILVLLFVIGFYIIWRHRDRCRLFLICPLTAFFLLIAYFLTTRLPFQFLISYERADYSLRILNVLALFLLPLALVAIYALVKKISEQNVFIKLAFLLFLTAVITAAHYGSYPRYDNYYNSHGYAVSAYDIEAVRWINNHAKTDYIVLANQQVSAAAIKEFGFAKYYHSNIFYYPVPTGGPLYPFYLDMVYKNPDRETMFKAMDLAGVRQSYFVLNKYWWAFPKVLAEAKLSADSWQEIGQGQVFIFFYKK